MGTQNSAKQCVYCHTKSVSRIKMITYNKRCCFVDHLYSPEAISDEGCCWFNNDWGRWDALALVVCQVAHVSQRFDTLSVCQHASIVYILSS